MTNKLPIRLGLCLMIWLFSLINMQARNDSLLIRAHFNDRPLEEVLNHLSDTYQLSFSYEPTAVEGVRITAHIEERPLDEAIAVIFGASGLEYLILANKQIMLRPKPEVDALLQASIALNAMSSRPKILTIKGYIRDLKNGMPLPYANISLPGTKYGTISEQDGHFTFNIPYTEEDVNLRFSYIGYNEKNIRLENTQRQIIVGMQAQHRSLPTVEIEEKPSFLRQNERISQLTLSPAQLSSMPSLGQHDLMHALKYMPGINGLDESSAGFSVRGGTEDENLIILDDMTLYNIDHFWGVFSTFNPEAIEQVNLYKSNFPIRYGGKTSSVIELTGKTASSDKVSGGIGINMLSSNLSLEVPLGKKLNISLYGRRSYTDIVQSQLYENLFDFAQSSAQVGNPDNNEDQPINTLGTQKPDYHFYDFHTKLQFTPQEGERMSISLFQGGDVIDLSSDRTYTFKRNRTNVTIDEVTKNLTKWNNQGGSLQWEKQWTPNISTYASGSFSNYEREFELSTQTTRTVRGNSETKEISRLYDANNIQSYTFRGHLNWNINLKNRFKVGGEYSQNQIAYRLEFNDKTPADRTNEGGIAAIFAEYNFTPSQSFEFNIGLRDNYFQPLSKHYVSPRISVNLFPNQHLQLKAAWGKYYQFTQEVDLNQRGNVRDIWLLANGQQIPVNNSTHYVGGFAIKYPDFLIDVEAYRKDMDGLATFVALTPTVDSVGNRPPQPPPVYKFFQGTGTAVGLDILIQKTSGLYTGWLAYSLGKVTHQFENINRNQPFPAEEDQRHQVKLVNMLKLGKWDLSLTWVYGSGRVYSDVEGQINDRRNGRTILFNTERLPAYQRIDIGATYNFNMGRLNGELGGSIYNLFDRQNVKYRQYLYSIEEQSPSNNTAITRVIGDDAELLGFTPNLFLNIKF